MHHLRKLRTLLWLAPAVHLSLLFGEVAICGETEQDKNPILHGTINIVLANRNGFVVVTDSMQTTRTSSGERQLSEHAQKLFRLDDHSVCTVAGFGSATISAAPEFNTHTAGLLAAYQTQLASQNIAANFREKLTSLSFLFGFHLSSLAGLRDTIGLPNGDYSFQLILAGYDNDGTPKVGRLALRPVVSTYSPGQSVITVETETAVEMPVGKELLILVAGQPDVATEILRNPTRFASNPAVKRYIESYEADRGASFTIDDMKRLAEFIFDRTANKHPSVGGPRQVAILQNSRIVTLEQPTFTSPPAPMHFNLMVGSHLEGRGLRVEGPITFLFLKTQFIGDPELSLDGHYFFGNDIVRCRVVYDGGFMRFDPSNRVDDSVLVIGQHANLKSDQLYRLVHNFPWREVIYEKR
jgi:20S proteasome alpha/beta subunit